MSRSLRFMRIGGLLGTCVAMLFTACSTSSEPTFNSTEVPPVTKNNQWKPRIQSFNGVEMVLVPPGCFTMGTDDPPSTSFGNENPTTKICFDKPFWIDRYDVTNKQFTDFNGTAENPGRWADDKRPRESISWFRARDFCVQQRGARLPTEAEWEYAARGPDNLVYPWGNSFDANKVVYGGNSDDQTRDVGSKPGGVSWVGAFDMTGNVWQWVSSLYRSYPYNATDGRESNVDVDNLRVLRGGSWVKNMGDVHSAVRFYYDPHYMSSYFGFRCARSF
jgi:formylglycine-generating enzyme required for sulfatase activity